jgi:hypothetical protein
VPCSGRADQLELRRREELTRRGQTATAVVARQDCRGPLVWLIYTRWIDKYNERQVSALADLKAKLEGKTWRPKRKRA